MNKENNRNTFKKNCHLSDSSKKSMAETICHSCTCVARQVLKESLFSAWRIKRTYAASDSSGRSMVEMLGVLAIIAVLSASALAGYSKAMFKHKMTQTIEIFNGVLQKVIELEQKKWGTTAIGLDGDNGIAEETVSYGLLQTCNKVQGEFWNNDSACQLPIGIFQMALYQNAYSLLGGYLMVSFHNSKSCVSFLSSHFENSTPIEWWQTEYAGIEVCSNETCYNNWVYHPYSNKTTYNISDITQACQICDEENACSVFFTIRYEV